MGICGIDEAGRGCVAGPMVVAGVNFFAQVDGLKDSKKLSAKRREDLFEKIKNSSNYHIVVFTNSQIDDLGVSKCLKLALNEIKESIFADEYIFDGNSSFGVSGIDTLIKADTKVLEVSAASILAKVTKDRLLLEEAKELKYDFLSHQGYATKKHIEEIKAYGYSHLHRKSFKIKKLNETFLFNEFN